MVGRPRSRTWLEGRDAIPMAAVAVIGIVFFGPALGGRWPLLRDFRDFTLPSRALWRAAVLAGRLPQWNPFVGVGVPLTAAPVHGSCYPGHLPLLAGEAIRMLPAVFALHAVIAGLGAYALARSIRCGALASAIAGTAWMLGGYAVSMWGDGEKVLSGAWVPLAAGALVAHARAPGFRSLRLLLAAVALALTALAGDPFLWLDILALAVPLAWAMSSDAASRVILRVAAALGLALLLASPELLPAWLLKADTHRATDLALAAAERWSMHPVRLLELLAPGALGDPTSTGHYAGAAFADDPAFNVQPWALSLYGGAVCACLPFAAARSRTTGALVLSASAGLLAALGRYTPVHALLRAVIVPMRWMRYPEKHALVVVGALALLAALGCDRLLDRRVSPWRPLVAMAVLGLAAWLFAPTELRATLLSGLARSGVAAVAAVGAVAIASRHRQAAALVVLSVALDLGIADAPLLPWNDGAAIARPPVVETILSHPTPAPPRLLRPGVGTAAIDTLSGNLPSLWGIAALPGDDPARSVRLDLLASRLGQAQLGKLARLLRIDWALGPSGLREGAHLSRAWIAGAARVADDESAAGMIARPDFDPERAATVAPSPTAHDLASQAYGECSVATFAAERVELDCESSGDALVVISEAHATGWTATIDGVPAALERADVALRGVWIPVGAHRVALVFETPGLHAGLGLCALGALLSLGVGVRWRRVRIA